MLDVMCHYFLCDCNLLKNASSFPLDLLIRTAPYLDAMEAKETNIFSETLHMHY